MTLEEFTKMVNNHDLTYEYSDDHRYWVAGDRQYKAILEAAKQFPREEVVRIWNAMVEKRVIEAAWPTFKWKD